ncbi:MAG: hypothetical protein ACR2RE_04340 [Geminicoccaceae bacterium]
MTDEQIPDVSLVDEKRIKHAVEDRFRMWLHAEGKFQAFKVRVQQLRDAGLDNRVSWYKAAEEFGLATFRELAAKEEEPKAKKEPPARVKDMPHIPMTAAEDIEQMLQSGKRDFAADVRWAYEQFSNKDLTEEDAIKEGVGAGAWSMLEFARKNQATTNTFFGQLVPKILGKAEQEEADQEEEEDEQVLDARAHVEDLKQWLSDREGYRSVECPACNTWLLLNARDELEIAEKAS